MQMTYKDWIKQTAVLGLTRSAELKKIDTAFQQYEQALSRGTPSDAAKTALQAALAAWQDAKKKEGKDWRSSIRNRTRAVEKLAAELAPDRPMLSVEELSMMREMERDARINAITRFRGRQFTLRNTQVIADIGSVAYRLAGLRQAASKLQGGMNPAARAHSEDLLSAIFGGDHANLVSPEVVTDLGLGCAALAAFFPANPMLVKNIVKAVKGYRAAKYCDKARRVFAPEHPQAALDAVHAILVREYTEARQRATVQGIAGAVKPLFAMLDGGAISGPAVTVVEKFLLALQALELHARDQSEIHKANQVLATANLFDLSLFQECPLVGCYFLAINDTSALISMAVTNYGRPGWKLEVEEMVKAAAPVFEQATRIIRDSRYEIKGLQGKGTIGSRVDPRVHVPFTDQWVKVRTGYVSGKIADATRAIDRQG